MAVTGIGTGVQIGKESTWGTSVAGAKIINFTSESIKATADKKTEDSLIASTSPSGKDLMGLRVAGDLSFILRPEFAGYLMKQAFGGTDTVTANSPVTGSYKHSIPLVGAAGVLPSATILIDRKVAVKKYSGCKIDNLSLDAVMGDYVKGTITIKGKDESTGVMASLAALTLQSFKCVGATLTMGGTSYDAKSVKFSLANKLEDVGQTYGSGLYSLEPVHAQREAKVDIEINYGTDIETLYDTYGVTDTKLATVVLDLKSPSFIIGTTQYELQLTLANVAIDPPERNVSGAGVQVSKISGVALSIGATEPVIAVIYDAQTTAY